MPITLTSPTDSRPIDAPRDVTAAVLTGMKCRCPKCGVGKLYRAYLKVVDSCPVCGEELHHNRTDDAPPWAVMLIVCHIVGGGVLSMEQAWAPDMWKMLAFWFPVTIAMCLGLLPVVKGGFVGLQWGLRMHGFGFGAGPDPAVPMPEPVPARER